MEKWPHEQIRDEFAKKLKDIRNSENIPPEKARTKAQGYLEATKKFSHQYATSKSSHLNLNKVLAERATYKDSNFSVTPISSIESGINKELKDKDAEVISFDLIKEYKDTDDIFRDIHKLGFKDNTKLFERIVLSEKKNIKLVALKSEDLVGDGPITMRRLYDTAKKFGLGICPKDTALKLRTSFIPEDNYPEYQMVVVSELLKGNHGSADTSSPFPYGLLTVSGLTPWRENIREKHERPVHKDPSVSREDAISFAHSYAQTPSNDFTNWDGRQGRQPAGYGSIKKDDPTSAVRDWLEDETSYPIKIQDLDFNKNLKFVFLLPETV